MKEFNRSIAKRIDKFRLQRGLSWEKLAYSAGIAKSTMSEIKQSKFEIKLSNLYKITNVLNISVIDFLSEGIELSEFDF